MCNATTNLCCVVVYCLLGGEVTLVPYEQLVDVLTCTSVDFVQPLLHVVEGIGVGHIVHHDDAVCSAIVATCDCAEALLSSSVPYLQFDCLTVQVDCADFL